MAPVRLFHSLPDHHPIRGHDRTFSGSKTEITDEEKHHVVNSFSNYSYNNRQANFYKLIILHTNNGRNKKNCGHMIGHA